MFAILALVAFVLALFDVTIGTIDMVILGLAFIAAHPDLGVDTLAGAVMNLDPSQDQDSSDDLGQDTFWWRLVHLEPTVWRAAVVAVVALLGSVGILVAPGVPDALVGALAAVLVIVQMAWTRPAVTANAKVVVVAPDPIGEPATVTAGQATTAASSIDILAAAKDVPRE